MADYCVYWLRRAQDHLPECTPRPAGSGRAGLVGTQNIRNNKSREGGLDHICAGGTVVEAVDNQPWSGEANVHVSIVNWVKHPPARRRGTAREKALTREKFLIPEKKKLWFKVEPPPGKTPPAKRGNGGKRNGGNGNANAENGGKEYQLAFRETPTINSAMSDRTDIAAAAVLRCNTDPQRSFNGQMLGHKAFLLHRRRP